MSRSLTLNVRVHGPLGQFVADNVGDTGMYENVSEYIRDLIRKDKERTERERFERLKAELRVAFTASEDSYVSLTAQEVITRNRTSKGV
ncbi:MAG: addiction module antitoxin [Sphingomonas sp.]|nr:addiction module antitoxin [Sphingomonas sp.]